jgi:ferredoxin
MDTDLKTAMYDRGADVVRFVDISELSPRQTQGFTKAIIFCLPLSKEFVTDVYNNIKVEQDDYLEKEQKVNELAEWLASYIQQKGYRAYAQSENNNLQKCDICKRICPAKAIHGNEWTQEGGRENLVDVFRCSCPLKCMVNCPWTLRYAGVMK